MEVFGGSYLKHSAMLRILERRIMGNFIKKIFTLFRFKANRKKEESLSQEFDQVVKDISVSPTPTSSYRSKGNSDPAMLSSPPRNYR